MRWPSWGITDVLQWVQKVGEMNAETFSLQEKVRKAVSNMPEVSQSCRSMQALLEAEIILERYHTLPKSANKATLLEEIA